MYCLRYPLLFGLCLVTAFVGLDRALAADALTAPAVAVVEDDNAKPATEPLMLARGAFEVAWYLPGEGRSVRGFFVLGSGDGGWSYWETRVARHLVKNGWAVAGVDFALYATTDFTQEILAADYTRMVNELGRRTKQAVDGRIPLVYGGWSMGAEQAMPAAAVAAGRPEGLRGLLMVAPGQRGRYGLHTPDKLGITPTGEGTFGLADFAPQLRGLKLAQLHAGLDPLDSIDWQNGLPLIHRLWEYPRAFHDFDNASPAFLALMDKAINWLLVPLAGRKKSS